MRSSRLIALAAALASPLALRAQTATTPNPISTALKSELAHAARNLGASAESMPADKYSFKPTPAQMSFGEMMLHVANTNDFMCSVIAGSKAPDRAKISAATASKETLVARVKASFDFCTSTLASTDDSKLGDNVPFFGGRTISRGGAMMGLVGDWSDHYSASANYLRLNGILPPTARPRT